jgi:hypothetical protein
MFQEERFYRPGIEIAMEPPRGSGRGFEKDWGGDPRIRNAKKVSARDQLCLADHSDFGFDSNTPLACKRDLNG